VGSYTGESALVALFSCLEMFDPNQGVGKFIGLC
jgi:hypothetical protein